MTFATWSRFPPQKLYHPCEESRQCQCWFFWPMSHMRQMGSILGGPCCLQATQSSNGILVLDHLCTSSVVQAQSFLLQIPWPQVSKKKKSLEECPFLFQNVPFCWITPWEWYMESLSWKPFGIIRKIFHKGFQKLGRFWTKCTSYNSVRSPTKNLYIGNIWDWPPQIFGQSDGIIRIGCLVSCERKDDIKTL